MDESVSRKAAHTPGPWRIREERDTDRGILVDCGDPTKSWTVGNVASVANYAPYMSSAAHQHEQEARAEANAHLIAASPALYDALKRLRSRFDALLAGHPVHDVAETRAEVDAAIAQAEGA